MTRTVHAFRVLFSLSAALLAAPHALACFTVYNKANVPVYSNMSPPIDMSYQIHQRLPAVFPGGHMVFGASTDCPVIDTRVAVPELSNAAVATAIQPASNRVSRATSKPKN
jgi:hypothetical protein